RMAATGGRCVPLLTPQASTVTKGTSTRITTTTPHGLQAGSSIVISNASGGWTAANGIFPITVLSATELSIPVDSTSFAGNFNGVLSYPPVLFHSDLTAIITGPGADRFPYNDTSPSFNENSAEPDRRQPYREFTIHYHNPQNPVQPFQEFTYPNLTDAYNSVQDMFAINYGIAGIGAEILASRLGVGPEGNADAVELKFEEFFLSSWAVGDPAMVVDIPANSPNQTINQTQAPG